MQSLFWLLRNYWIFIFASLSAAKKSKLSVKLENLLTQCVSSRYKYNLCTYVLHHNGIISIYINSKNMHRKVSIRISNSRRNSISWFRIIFLLRLSGCCIIVSVSNRGDFFASKSQDQIASFYVSSCNGHRVCVTSPLHETCALITIEGVKCRVG